MCSALSEIPEDVWVTSWDSIYLSVHSTAAWERQDR